MQNWTQKRPTAEAAKAFAKFASAKTAKEAVMAIASFIGSSLYEQKETIKYDENTGKPKQQEWRPVSEKWDGVMGPWSWSECDSVGYRSITKIIKEGDVGYVQCGESFIVVTHVPVKGEQGGSTADHLHFQFAKSL